MNTNLIWADFLALVLYFVIIIGIGIWVCFCLLKLSSTKKTRINYFNSSHLLEIAALLTPISLLEELCILSQLEPVFSPATLAADTLLVSQARVGIYMSSDTLIYLYNVYN